jgi:thiosulfate reductase cytochrome b subunit
VSVIITGMRDTTLEIAPLEERGLVKLTVIHQGDRHVAVFTPHEVTAANRVLTDIPPRCEPYDLTAALQAAIGRNPFDRRTLPTRSPRPNALLYLSWIVVGLSFATQNDAWWQKLAGWSLATTGLAYLAAQARTHLRTPLHTRRQSHRAPTPRPDPPPHSGS